jgi:hypothetical protein
MRMILLLLAGFAFGACAPKETKDYDDAAIASKCETPPAKFYCLRPIETGSRPATVADSLPPEIQVDTRDLTEIIIQGGKIEFRYKAFSCRTDYFVHCETDSIWKNIFTTRGGRIVYDHRAKARVIPEKKTPETVEWPD